MSGCPLPPKTSRTQTIEEAPLPQERYESPPIPAMGTPDYMLTDNETAFILKATLRPDQYEDPKVLSFINNYLRCRSSAQAAREAGLATRVGDALRMKPEIHAAIEAITQKAVMKYGYDASELVERTKELANVDLASFENPDGSFKTHLSQLDPEVRRAVKKFKAKNLWGEDANGMKIVTGQLIEVELWDKLKAIDMLAREKNIFKETRKVEHDVTQQMASLLLESQARGQARRVEAPRDVGPLIENEGKVENDVEG